ncbi:MAG TPA: protein-glutamate O-methyltransferase CheR [Steroidobacteraceae bacterium]|nr:protein-glutamate O-methyltransferase CheR [Steroidobacteraceae bacterium]
MISNQLREALAAPRVREFDFGNEDFEALRQLVKRLTGINLSDQKRELVYGRLARRLRVLHLRTFAEYRDLLASDGGREIGEFCNAITTNLTSFFRESHHFEYLREQVLQPMVANRTASHRVRIWSAGCSTGEEAYSLAMTVIESIPDLRTWDVKILATDLDSDVLAKAQRGIYAAERVRAIGAQRLSRFFAERRGREGATYEVKPELTSLITFKQLNLMHPLPMKGPLDAIFCRNVVIYFDKDTQRELFSRVAQLQRPGHLLFLGHSESLFKVSESYTPIGKTVYRRS